VTVSTKFEVDTIRPSIA